MTILEKAMEKNERYMDKMLEAKKQMTTKDCEIVLNSMAVGASRTEKEALEYAIKKMKSAKKAKRWKRKYLDMRSIVEKAAEVLDYSDRNGLHLSYPAWIIAHRLGKALEPYLLERLKGGDA